MLELESGSNDPMAYMLTIVLIQFIQSSGMGVPQILGSFAIQFIVGAATGYFLGKLAIPYAEPAEYRQPGTLSYPVAVPLYSSPSPSPTC